MNNSQAVRILCRLNNARLEEAVEYLSNVLRQRKNPYCGRCQSCGKTIQHNDRRFAGAHTNQCEACITESFFEKMGGES